MIPSAGRACARVGRAVWPLLLVVGGVLACGGERPDATATGELAAAAKPAPGGECRRFVTCVPENPCHTGWVTGCRKNVPICTDIGGWLDNGATCGSAAVCYMGQCLPCAAGETCVVRDQWQYEIVCRAGAISCASGQPLCQDVGPAPDGRACWQGAVEDVCRGGQCVRCVDGETCQLPDQRCHVAQWTGCRTNGGTCTDTGTFVADGSSCPFRENEWSSGVCVAGGCNACDWYQPCEPAPSTNDCIDQATYGYTWCASGAPECVPSWSSPKPDGTGCAIGVCAGGTCVPPCVSGEPCTDAASCRSGMTACNGPYGWCSTTGPAPDGTSCAAGAFCASGACTACGTPCSARDFCHASGVLSCDDGLCAPGPALEDGTACGAGEETCTAGSCGGAPGAPIVTRGASGLTVDLTGIAWSRCSSDSGGLTSRRTTDTYGAGTITHVEETFASNGSCAGAPDEVLSVLGSATSAGYRWAGWAGDPPAGAPFEVLATAVELSVVDHPVVGTMSMKILLWIDDLPSPRLMYQADGDGPLAADGYPLRLFPETDPLREVVSMCGAPCDPGFPTCAAHAVDCSGPSAVCAPTGATLADREPCGDGMTCSAGVCAAVTIRTVTGTAETTFWSDAGASLPAQWYGWWRSAVVFTGQTTTRQVEADSMGTPFNIAGVPQATYVLRMSGVPYAPAKDVEMAGGTWNVGLDVLGRADVTWGSGAPVTLLASGLAPVGRSDVVGLVCTNVGEAMYPFGGPGTETLPLGAESAVTTVPWYGPILDPARDDVAYLFQAATTWDAVNGTSITTIAGWATLPDTQAVGADQAAVEVALAPCPETRTVSADWQISQFAAYAPQVGQGATVRNGRMAIFARPHADPFAPGWRTGETFGYPGGVPLLVVRGGTRSADFSLSGLTYGRFLPPLWREYRQVRTVFEVPVTAPGASRAASLSPSIGWIVPEDAAPAILVPTVSPPQELRIGGQVASDVLHPPADVGLMPVVSWTAPALLPSTGTPIYEVTVYELKNAGGTTQLWFRYTGETARMSYRLPGTNLSWNGRYVVTVTATVSERSIYAPLHQPVVRAFATAVSQPFTP